MDKTTLAIVIIIIVFSITALGLIFLNKYLSFKAEHIGDKGIFISNRDWLASLSNHDLTMLILGGLADFSKRSTQSQDFLEDWLDEEYNEELMKIYFPYLDYFRDKSVNIF